MITFETNGCLRMAEAYSFENGCIASSENYDVYVDYKIQGNTLAEVKRKIMDFIGCTEEDIMVNPCEDDSSRIDAQCIENIEGYTPSNNELALWKEGKGILFAVTYSFSFEEVNRKPAEFKK